MATTEILVLGVALVINQWITTAFILRRVRVTINLDAKQIFKELKKILK